MNCKNCVVIVEANFCAECGQKTAIGKITYKNVLSELSENVFQFNSIFLFTIKEMFFRPQIVVNEFLEGKRKKYSKPITFLITFSTLYLIISKLLGEDTLLNEFIGGITEAESKTNSQFDLSLILNWFSANYSYLTLILLPLFSFSSFLAFKSKNLNFFEHIVLNAYLAGQQAFICSVFIIIESVINDYYAELISLVLSVSFAFYVFWKVFSEGGRITNLLRTLCSYIIYLILIPSILIAINIIKLLI